MVEHIILIVVGLAVLLVAGDLLVRGAVSMAAMMKVPALLISLTIVAFGTSAPEFVVTLGAVTGGEGGIAIGNIIGSNIANVLMVLGLPAIIAPIHMSMKGIRRHASVMLVATAAFCWFAYTDQAINTTAGIILTAMIVAYVLYIGYGAMTGKSADDPILDEVEDYSEDKGGKWKTPVFLLAGLIGLPVGANLLIDHGATLAAQLHVRDELIGLTIVAFGTSLPELATVVTAALKRHADVAVGNVVGSNIFNLLFVGGTAGLAGNPSISDAARAIDLPVMAAVALLLAAFIYMRGTITRLIGVAMSLAYIGYVAWIGLKAGGV